MTHLAILQHFLSLALFFCPLESLLQLVQTGIFRCDTSRGAGGDALDLLQHELKRGDGRSTLSDPVGGAEREMGLLQ